MNFEDFKKVLPDLINVCKKTGAYQIENHNKVLEFRTKKDKTPVTEVDLCSNDIIKRALYSLTPEVTIVSEEDYQIKNNSSYFWIIDPLDGTKNYLKGNNHFCINIALIQDGEPILGLIYAPIFNLLFYAFKDNGAYRQSNEGKPVLIKTKQFLIKEKAVIYTSSSVNENVCRKLRKHFKNIEIITSSSALKFGYIASGQGSFYPRLGPTHEWDTASGQCIVEEAGGMVVDKYMKRLKYNKNSTYLNNEFFVIGDSGFDWEQVIKSAMLSVS